MSLTRQDVEKIAHLARLSITEARDAGVREKPVEHRGFRGTSYREPIPASVEPMAHPLDGQRQRLRADVVAESDQHEKYQANAPQPCKPACTWCRE
jgi:aspartyl-tRNA(Asn)/glutamyl-tRNA(Gln) amidotransferase subunit C